MKEIFIVKTEQSNMAHRIEEVLLSLSESIGILFVSVKVEAPLIFNILIGIRGKKEICEEIPDETLVEYIAKYFLQQEEAIKEAELKIIVRRGIIKSLISS